MSTLFWTENKKKEICLSWACDRCEILPEIPLINGYKNCTYISGIKSHIPTWEEHAINEFYIKKIRTRCPHAQTPTSVDGKRYSAWCKYPDNFNLNQTHWEATRPIGKMQWKLNRIKMASHLSVCHLSSLQEIVFLQHWIAFLWGMF